MAAIPPPREAPAHLNCTAKRFIDLVLSGVVRQLEISGLQEAPESVLTYHLDAGRSQPEGGGRAIPGPVTVINASHAAGPNCTAEQLASCARGIGDLASLEGLAEYLTEALEHGVAKPTPKGTAELGWGAVARAVLEDRQKSPTSSSSSEAPPGPMQLGGGSGAGFQIICGDRGLASAGGGGGGGAFGTFAQGKPLHAVLQANGSLGGGGGGGMQLFYPVNASEDPWGALHWKSWSTGGGSGCGSCKPSDAACLARAQGVECGAKFDDVGAVNESEGRSAVHSWRTSVLRRCFDAGRLAVIGGGGGGAGGAECCKAVPSLNFGFGFYAEVKPAQSSGTQNLSSLASADAVSSEAAGCCPELHRWNVTMAGQSSSGSGTVKVAVPGEAPRRLQEAVSDEVVDPFGRENTGKEAPGGGNRRPTLDEMIKQHASRLGVDASEMLNLTQGPRCAIPAWLNGTEDEESMAANSSKPGGSATKEPEVALKWIYKFNPLHGFLAEGANACGSWAKWCCVCHAAQRRIACLPELERSKVDFFLTEDCCESKLSKNTSSPGFVVDATPPRNTTLAWRPGSGWVELPQEENVSDSYTWTSDLGPERRCAMLEVSALPWLKASESVSAFPRLEAVGADVLAARPTEARSLLMAAALVVLGLCIVRRRRAAESVAVASARGFLETELCEDSVMSGNFGGGRSSEDMHQTGEWSYMELT